MSETSWKINNYETFIIIINFSAYWDHFLLLWSRNKGPKEEIKMLKEENAFLKAENVVLKKEIEELYKKLEGEGVAKTFGR